jgi:hypothetical protein
MRRPPPLSLLVPVLAAGLIAAADRARAIETWVGTNGEIRVVPGTEDPVPAPTGPAHFVPVKPRVRPAAKPAEPQGAKARPPSATAKPSVLVKARLIARQGKIDPRRTGSIEPTNPPTTASKPTDPNAALNQPPPPPLRPAQPLVPQTAPEVIDPGNPRIVVDPSRDTLLKTNEDGLEMDPTVDINATPGALPTNPINPTSINPTATYPTSIYPTEPIPAVNATGRPAATGAAATPQPGNGPAAKQTGTPRQATPISAPLLPLQPQGSAGVTGAIAVAPQPATTPNPRSPLDDPLTDPQATAYDAAGVRINSFTWRPAIEASVGRTTNIQQVAGGNASSALRLAPELIGQSNWSRHELDVDVHGSFTEFPADWALYRPTVSATLSGRVDFSDDTRLALKTSFGLDKLPSTSALSAAGSTAAGLQQTVTASAGLTRDIGRFALTLRGEVDRTDYQLNPGVTTPASGLDNTDLITVLRGTYNLSAGVKPFIEVQADTRRYDGPSQDTPTSPPTSHDTTGAAAKTGVTLDLGPLLTGEASTGYGFENPTTRSLQQLNAVTLDENLIWSPTRLTRVTFSTVTAIEPSLVAGASGAVSRTFGVKIADDIFRNLTLDLGASYLARHYTGFYRTEYLDEVTGGLTWKINPTLQTFVRGTFDSFSSSAHPDDYNAATIFAGVRLQK